MLCYVIVWTVENTESKNPRVVKTKIERSMVSSNCVVWGIRKSEFIKEQEATRLLSSLGIRTPLSQIPLVARFLF